MQKVVRILELMTCALTMPIWRYYRRHMIGTSLLNIRGIPDFRGKGRIIIRHGVRLNSGHAYNPIGGDSKLTLFAHKNAIIEIDNYCGVSNATIVAWKKVYVGKGAFIGGSVKIYDTDFHNINRSARANSSLDIANSQPVHIEDGVFIGAHSIILKGVRIGSGSVVGAGSVVSKDIPANQVWAGNPAKLIRRLDA